MLGVQGPSLDWVLDWLYDFKDQDVMKRIKSFEARQPWVWIIRLEDLHISCITLFGYLNYEFLFFTC